VDVFFLRKEQYIFLFMFLKTINRTYPGNIHCGQEAEIIGSRATSDNAK
jgi:hypothetical protein